jgi:ribose transport system substrate-binding protein
MTRTLLLGALAVSAAAAAVLARPAAADDPLVFALVPKNVNNPFFDVARDGCKKAEQEMAGKIECLYIGPGEHGGGDEQVQMVNDLIVRKVAGLAVSAANAPAMATALKAAKEAGIPVITWDADLLAKDKDLRTAYVGTKNYDIGVNLAKLVQQIKPQGGTICLQSGGAAAANHNERLQGIRDTLSGQTSEQAPGQKLTGQQGWTEVAGCPLYTDDDPAKAVQQMEDTLLKNAELDAFVSTGAFTQWNPDAYKNGVQGVKQRVDSKDLALIVADTLPVQMKLLEEGYSLGQVGQRPFEMGYKAMYFLYDMVKNGKNPADPTYTGLDVCTPETAKTCIGS